MWKEPLSNLDGREQVDLHETIKRGLRHFIGAAIPRNTRIVDQDIKRGGMKCAVQHLIDLLRIAEIADIGSNMPR